MRRCRSHPPRNPVAAPRATCPAGNVLPTGPRHSSANTGVRMATAHRGNTNMVRGGNCICLQNRPVKPAVPRGHPCGDAAQAGSRAQTMANSISNSGFHKVKLPASALIHLCNTCYAFFFRNMLLSSPRFTRISGMWYLVAFGEIKFSIFTGCPARPYFFCKTGGLKTCVQLLELPLQAP